MKRSNSSWTHRRQALALLGATVAGVALPAAAQKTWPERPISWVVGYAPGGTTDVLARVVATAVSARLGQTVVVENKSGANSNIAAEAVARATPDGYQFFVGTIANAINATLYKRPGYDLRKDFEPVALLASTANVLVVNPQAVSAKSVSELIQYARANPGKLGYASSGAGSSIHLSAVLFAKEARLDLVHIPYRGSAPAMTDLLGGQVQLMFDNLPSALPHIRAGRLRALGVTTQARFPIAPELPTIGEAGLPGFHVDPWFALFAPAGTPDAVRARMAAVIADVMKEAGMQARLKDLGMVASAIPAARARGYVEAEVARWADVVRDSGASVD